MIITILITIIIRLLIDINDNIDTMYMHVCLECAAKPPIRMSQQLFKNNKHKLAAG